jgi:hypothetical protein
MSACGGAHLGVADSDGSGGDHHIMLPLNGTLSVLDVLGAGLVHDLFLPLTQSHTSIGHFVHPVARKL